MRVAGVQSISPESVLCVGLLAPHSTGCPRASPSCVLRSHQRQGKTPFCPLRGVLRPEFGKMGSEFSVQVAILMSGRCREQGGSFVVRTLKPLLWPPCPDCEAPSGARGLTGGPPSPVCWDSTRNAVFVTRMLRRNVHLRLGDGWLVPWTWPEPLCRPRGVPWGQGRCRVMGPAELTLPAGPLLSRSG